MKHKNKNIILIILSVSLLLMLIFAACDQSKGAITDTDTQTGTDIADTTNDTSSDSSSDTRMDTVSVNDNTNEITQISTLIENTTLSESEKQQLYTTAAKAVENCNYQYAYGLYMRLAAEGYSDSLDKAAQLRRKAYSMPVATVSKDVFYQLADTEVIDNCGFLYLDEKGTPQYIYAIMDENNEIKINSLTPYPELTDVSSIAYADSFHASQLWVCILIMEDGTMKYMYDEPSLQYKQSLNVTDFRFGKNWGGAVEDLNNHLRPFLEAQTDIVQIEYIAESFDFILLKADGTVIPYHMAMKSDEVKEWKNIVDIRYEYPSLVKGLDKDGNYFSTIETEEKFVLNKIHYIGNSVIDGGTIYSVNDDNSVIIQKENVVFDIYVPSKQYSSNSDIYYILYDGKIVNQNDDVIAEAQDYSYIYSKDFLSYRIQGEFYMIGNDGKVEKVFHRYYEDETWFKMLVEKLQTVTVKVK